MVRPAGFPGALHVDQIRWNYWNYRKPLDSARRLLSHAGILSADEFMMTSSVELRKNAAADRGPVTVVLADDECMFRVSLRHLLTAPPSVIKDVYGVEVGRGFQVVGEASSGEEAIAVVDAVKPDLLLLDLSMPRKTGLEALGEMRSHRDRMCTIMLAGVIDRTHLLT